MKRQRPTDLVPLPSTSSVNKSLGKTAYTRGRHPVKQAINDWILSLACRELPPPSSPLLERFALLLETGSSQTIDTLLSKSTELGITGCTIVVPNPSREVCLQISASHPNVLTVPTTSHELIRLLAENLDLPKEKSSSSLSSSASTSNEDPPPSPLLDELLSRGWKGVFDFVWLDYCGTFSSRPGRKRQADLRRLFRQKMIPSPGLLVVTLKRMTQDSRDTCVYRRMCNTYM